MNTGRWVNSLRHYLASELRKEGERRQQLNMGRVLEFGFYCMSFQTRWLDVCYCGLKPIWQRRSNLARQTASPSRHSGGEWVLTGEVCLFWKWVGRADACEFPGLAPTSLTSISSSSSSPSSSSATWLPSFCWMLLCSVRHSARHFTHTSFSRLNAPVKVDMTISILQIMSLKLKEGKAFG